MNKFVVKKSSAGLGLFATEIIKKGECIIEYVGETISESEANKRGGKYLFELKTIIFSIILKGCFFAII
jgi:SET domain-containing protein